MNELQRLRRLKQSVSSHVLAVMYAFSAFPANVVAQPQPVSACVRDWSRLRTPELVISKEQHARLVQRAKANDRDSQYQLYRAIRIEGSQTPLPKEDRLKWLELSATNGSFKAQMAKIVEQHGWIDTHPDHGARYVELWERAAAEGDAGVAYGLAMIQRGVTEGGGYAFVKRYELATLSLEKYRHWLEVAANRGHWEAAQRLCAHHHRGDTHAGYPRAPGEALRWCTLAAQYECSPTAPLLLWEMFREGQGVEKNERVADYWKQLFDERDRRARLRRDPALNDISK